MTLGTPVTQSAPAVSPAADFRYDGGPAAPLPIPAPAATSSAPVAEDLPIALKAAPAPYRYKAYGEK